MDSMLPFGIFRNILIDFAYYFSQKIGIGYKKLAYIFHVLKNSSIEKTLIILH